MKKKEQGVLTIEASIVLIIFLLFVLFLFSFARLYRAQNMVSHAVMQSADAIALESYLRELAHNEDAEKIVELGNELTGVTSFSADNFTSLRMADVPKIAKGKFIAAVADSEVNADAKLKQLGVKDGLQGMDFSKSKMDLKNNDVIVHVAYKLKMQFASFGFNEITVTKAGKAKTFGDILFSIVTIPNDDRKGTASGGGSYKHGEVIEIVATPQYGYYFDGWDDNGDGIVDYDAGDPVTTSKRTVTVTDAKTYTAIFKNNGYAVITSVIPEGIAQITPGGTYDYGSKVEVTVTNDNPHYDFIGWTGQLFQDLDGDGAEEKMFELPRETGKMIYTISEVQGVYWIEANFKPKQYRVTVEHNNGGSVKIDGDRISTKTITYPQEVTLEATPSVGFEVDYWMKDGVRLEGSTGKTIWQDLPVVGDVVYKVVFKSTKVTVKFLGPDGNPIEQYTVRKGKSFKDDKLMVPAPIVVDGKVFDGWKNFSASTRIHSDTTVAGNWVKPSITISRSIPINVQSAQLTARIEPSSLKNATITWRAEVDPGYPDAVTINKNTGKVDVVRAGWTRVWVTLTYKGITCEDSVVLEIGESMYRMVYCMNSREYTNVHDQSRTNSSHHCYDYNNLGYDNPCCDDRHTIKEVPYSFLQDSPNWVEPGEWMTVDGDTYSGKNVSSERGYKMWNNTGWAIYFEEGLLSGPGGYYIKSIHY